MEQLFEGMLTIMSWWRRLMKKTGIYQFKPGIQGWRIYLLSRAILSITGE